MNHHQPLVEALSTQGYYLIDDFLEQEHHTALLAMAQDLYQQGLFNEAKIGKNTQAHHNKKIRTDEIFWLDEEGDHPGIKAYLNKIRAIANLLNQQFFLGISEFETHFAAYQPGSFYKKHCDQFSISKSRKISCVYYLNAHWDETFGGELKLYQQNDQLIQTIHPQGNRFVCFNSELPHEVCVTRQPRYSLTGWLKTRSEKTLL